MSAKYSEGQKVDLIILRETDLGFVARINGVDQGLLYHNEIFERLEPGDELPGYIRRLREDGSIDLILQPFGNLGTEDLSAKILRTLEDHNGFLPVNDKTSAEDIYDLFLVSKKKYKMALGNLYKKRIITVSDDGIRLVKKR